MIDHLRKILNMTGFKLPCLRTLEWKPGTPWLSLTAKDPVATPKQTLAWILRQLESKNQKMCIGKFYLNPADSRSICELSVCMVNRDLTPSLPDHYLRHLSQIN